MVLVGSLDVLLSTEPNLYVPLDLNLLRWGFTVTSNTLVRILVLTVIIGELKTVVDGSRRTVMITGILLAVLRTITVVSLVSNTQLKVVNL